MSDLIPLAELLAEIDREIKRVPACAATLQRARSIALTIPTIDAAPVVRCRECRYMVGAFTNNKIECAKGYKHMGLDSFCSCGARMDAPERE